MGFQFYNPHPRGKFVGDCAKRAICKVTGRDYTDVKRELNRIKNETGRFNCQSIGVINEFAARHHWIRINIEDDTVMTGEEFCQAYPIGTYALIMPRHMVACVDGIIYDHGERVLQWYVSYAWMVK